MSFSVLYIFLSELQLLFDIMSRSPTIIYKWKNTENWDIFQKLDLTVEDLFYQVVDLADESNSGAPNIHTENKSHNI